MNEQMCEGPEAQEGSGVTGKAMGRDQPEYVVEPQEVKEEPGRGMQQRWEAQWQEFLQTLQAPHSAWGNPQLSETAPWDDAKAFLASFEQVAEACHWPRGEWVARLMPALSGEAQQAFSLLEARDKEDYGKVKAAILRGDALRRETQRQHFRQFCCQELEDPRRMYSRLQELCCQWLKPERHTKEQILELLVLEQFLASLPVDVQGWVRAGGPDSCAQAVALLEDFLVSRRWAKTEKWQEPLQECPFGPVDVKEEPLDVMQAEISKDHAERFQDPKQKIDGQFALPGTGITRPASLLPAEGQDVAEAELTKALGVQVDQVMNLRKMGAPLHMVEWTPMQSSQQTTFWKVLQQDGENVGCLDDGKGNQLKVKNYQVGGNEPEKTPRKGQGTTQENVMVKHEIQEERCESNQGQGTEPLTGCKESGELPEGLGAAQWNPSPVDTEEEKASFSKYSGRNHPKSGLVFEHSGDVCSEGSQLGEKIQSKSKLDQHHSSHMEEKNHDSLEYEVRLHSNTLAEHQIIPTGEKTYKCSDCGKSFSQRSNLLRHEMIHTGKKPHQCPNCGKAFSHRSYLLTHEMMHTGEKPHNCLDCGKKFSKRSALLRHEMIHAGKKPHKCPECGKSFSQRSHLLNHQVIHTEQKPHKCLECGKSFSRRFALLRHEMIHAGEKPHKCPECEKSFSQRSYLLTHQMMHSGEKPHNCLDCGKRFSKRSDLLRHEMLHTGKKPHQCPECGKNFSRRSNLLTHQIIHTEEKPHKCPVCGKSFSQRSALLRHEIIHTGKKPHHCPECGKNFSWRSDLIRHQKIHTERNLTGLQYVDKA